eukprot:scaffold56_cov121-Skeletonema_marinoi.AAC.5
MASSSAEEVLVLYGSQTGNSEAAAEQLSSLIPSKLSTSDNRTLTSRFCSSYGVGQAPIGARKFREVCDTILERFGYDDTTNDGKNNNGDKMLTGVNYALLGLGDSHYTTFFRNPTAFENALSTVGATRVGELGKADASGTGNMEQSKVIERWIDSIWKDLQPVIDKPMTEEEGLKLKKAHEQTWKLCLELYKEWKQTNYFALIGLFLPLGGVIVGILQGGKGYLTIAGDVRHSCSLLSSRGPNSQSSPTYLGQFVSVSVSVREARAEDQDEDRVVFGLGGPGAPPPASAIVSEIYLRG